MSAGEQLARRVRDHLVAQAGAPAGAPKERGPVNRERAGICMRENEHLKLEYDWLVGRGRFAEARKVIESQQILLDQASRDLGR